MAGAAKTTNLKATAVAKGISEIAGDAFSAGKSRVTIYRALKQLLCAVCDEAISEGALFTRRSLYGQGLRILPQCQKCVPFRMTGGEGRRSALLVSLVTSQPENKFVENRKYDAAKGVASGTNAKRC